MATPIKNPTTWNPPSGEGYIVTVGTLGMVTNALLPIVDNTVNHYPIVTTPVYNIPKVPTDWTGTGE